MLWLVEKEVVRGLGIFQCGDPLASGLISLGECHVFDLSQRQVSNSMK